MEVFSTRDQIQSYLNSVRFTGRSIGFVPTMGALHQGHLSLIEAARSRCDIVVCSIFVNPTQFNDKKDLENYPRPLEEDLKKLQDADCRIVFVPSTEEMYSGTDFWHLPLGHLDQVLEGKIRPGHYQGVTQIVKKLFDTIRPDQAYFGQKDYQQFKVISHMVKLLELDIELIRCPIIREPDGLAMSSRNVYLSQEERKNALALFYSLEKARQEFHKKTLEQLKADAWEFLSASKGIKPEYFEIYDSRTFEPAANKDVPEIIALTASSVGSIRIIDNMILN